MQSIVILKIIKEMEKNTGKNNGTKQLYSWQMFLRMQPVFWRGKVREKSSNFFARLFFDIISK